MEADSQRPGWCEAGIARIWVRPELHRGLTRDGPSNNDWLLLLSNMTDEGYARANGLCSTCKTTVGAGAVSVLGPVCIPTYLPQYE